MYVKFQFFFLFIFIFYLFFFFFNLRSGLGTISKGLVLEDRISPVKPYLYKGQFGLTYPSCLGTEFGSRPGCDY